MKIDLKSLSIEKAHAHLVKGDFTARELSENYLKEIEKRNPELNAYLEVFDDVLDQADIADEKIKEGKAEMLTGIPIALKDNILIKDRRVGAASKILEGYYATYDSTVAKKLKDQGAVFLGRTNMDEFAMGGSTENSAYGVTKNPYDTSRVSGGSSGGSAVAVSADLALVSLGSDTGGSIRQPASFCGLVGLKPTYGRVSRHGLIAMGSSLDQIGPFGKTVADAEILFDAIKGQDLFDGTTISEKTYPQKISTEKMLLGVPRKFTHVEGIDQSVLKDFDESLSKLEASGCEIKDIDLPNVHHSLPVYYVIMPAEVSSNMARFDGMRFGALEEGENGIADYFKTRGRGFGKEVRRRIILGTYVLSAGYYDAYYGKANAMRSLIRNDFEKVFASGVHAVVTPTTPTPAFKIGEKANDPLSMYLADIFTVTANITGMPAISIPSQSTSLDGKNLPLGIQFMAPHGAEEILFTVGKKFENMR